jgi:hypothetical protein
MEVCGQPLGSDAYLRHDWFSKASVQSTIIIIIYCSLFESVARVLASVVILRSQFLWEMALLYLYKW